MLIAPPRGSSKTAKLPISPAPELLESHKIKSNASQPSFSEANLKKTNVNLPSPPPQTPITTSIPFPTKKKSKKVVFDHASLLLDYCQQGISVHQVLDFKQLLSKVNPTKIYSAQKSMSLLHVACSYGHTLIAKSLLETGQFLINLRDTEGWTPLHCAVAEGHIAIISLLGRCSQYLVQNEFDIFVPDGPIEMELETYDEETIFDLIFEDKKLEIEALLKSEFLFLKNSSFLTL